MATNKRFLWFTEPGKDPVQVEMHDTDAMHALNVSPDLWSTEKPVPIADEQPETDEEIFTRLEREEAEKKAADEAARKAADGNDDGGDQ